MLTVVSVAWLNVGVCVSAIGSGPFIPVDEHA